MLAASKDMAVPSRSSFAHLFCDRCQSQDLADTFVADVVEAGEAERPAKHSHFHGMACLFVLRGSWPAVYAIQSDWTDDSLVHFRLKMDGHLGITEHSSNSASF